MKKKVLVVLLILVFLYCIGGVVYSIFVKQIDNKEKKPVKSNDIVSIKDYPYEMNKKKSTKLFKDNFLELKENLESSSVDYEAYAKSVAKLFASDFYTLSNKINKYDIGGVQFVFNEKQDNFKLKASETFYKYIEDNTDSNRQQELPLVSEVFVDSINEESYVIENTEYSGYLAKVKLVYEKDLGYDTDILLTLVKSDNIISVVQIDKDDVNE
mgnify:CR=1 FL=1